MKPLARYVLAAMLAGSAVLHGIPAGAQDYDDEDDYRDSAPDPDDYQDELSPYGNWIDHVEYGRVWHPRVAVGWRPYYDGHWAWTPYGWTWISSEPWGWTFHYGRWSYAPVWGWVWVPGTVWGPAWVDWYWDDGFVGWAPLSPFGHHVTIVNQFVFVREHDFCSPRIGRIVIDHRRLPRRFQDRWRHHDFGRGFRAPDRDRIERVSGHPVPRFDHKPPQTVAPRHLRDGDRLARPRNHNPDLGQARRGGWQRGNRGVDDAPDARPRPGRNRDDLDAHPRPGRNPDVARRGPRLSPPDPAPDFDAPGVDRPRRHQGDQRVMRGGGSPRPYPDAGRNFGGARQNPEGYRRPAPPAIPGGSMMVPQGGGHAREHGTTRDRGMDAGLGRGGGGGSIGRGERASSGRGERGGHGEGNGRGGGGRGDGAARGDGGGLGRGAQSGWR